MNIEDKILEQLHGYTDYEPMDLLREARKRILELRELNTNLSWAVDFANDQAIEARAQSGAYN